MNRAEVILKFLLGGELLVTALLLARERPLSTVHKFYVIRQTLRQAEPLGASFDLANKRSLLHVNIGCVTIQIKLGWTLLVTTLLLAHKRSHL